MGTDFITLSQCVWPLFYRHCEAVTWKVCEMNEADFDPLVMHRPVRCTCMQSFTLKRDFYSIHRGARGDWFSLPISIFKRPFISHVYNFYGGFIKRFLTFLNWLEEYDFSRQKHDKNIFFNSWSKVKKNIENLWFGGLIEYLNFRAKK